MGITNFTNDKNGNNNGNGGGMPPIMPSFSGMPDSSEMDVTELLVNMNQKHNSNVLFRDNLIVQMICTLIGKNKPNLILIGPAGTGKTAIVEYLADMIETKNPLIPNALMGKTIYNLQLSDIVAGTSLRGELEAKIKAIIDFFQDKKNNAILFIDEIHLLLDNNSTSYDTIAQILKPALSRGDISVIGATTTQESKAIDNDPAFSRRFSHLTVDELTKEQTVEILKKCAAGFTMHYGQPFNMDDDILNLLVNLADEFTTSGSHRPDNAITLLDNALADCYMNKQQMKLSDDPNIQALGNQMGLTLTPKNIEKTAKKLASGNSLPIDFSDEEFDENFKHLKGQDEVLAKVKKMMKIHILNLHPRKKPLSFMFLGPSGVGKTEIAKVLATTYLHNKPIIINCAEFTSSASLNRIIGAPAGYVGYSDKKELLLDPMISNPYQIVVWDELEKGCRELQRLLMEMLDEGKLVTNSGKIIDCSKAIFIATTNAMSTNMEVKKIGFSTSLDETHDIENIDLEELKNYFDIEFINRWEQKYKFNFISEDDFREITKNTYHDEVAMIKNTKPSLAIPDDMTDDELDEFTKEYYQPRLGARPIRSKIIEFIDEKLI